MTDLPAAPARRRPTTFHRMLAEVLGTGLLVFFGCGAVHAAVLTGAQSGLWQVAIVWGLAIMLAIQTVGAVSGAHLNPAMTLALAVHGRHAWRLVGPYWLGQFAGAFAAAALLFALFGGFLEAKERAKGVTRGEPGSIVTAMCYGEFFPNPGPIAAAAGPYDPAAHAELRQTVSHAAAWTAEFVGTLLLALIVFALTDETNPGAPPRGFVAACIGLTVAILISVIAPLTQAGFNPARDLGPRLFAAWAGWGSVSWPGWREPWWLTVYILAPMAGAVCGGLLYDRVVRPARAGGASA